MLKVIKEDEYEDETPKQYDIEDSHFQKKIDHVAPHEVSDDDMQAISNAIYNQPRNEPIPEPVAEPRYEAPVKEGFHQIRDTRVREQPLYQEDEGKTYVTPHEVSDEEAAYVDRVVNGAGALNTPEWNEANIMAQ